MPIKGIVVIILRQIYPDRVISANLKKRALKKLILDKCTKTAFSFNNKFYQQKDCVSMGSSLGPVWANIIMTKLENVIIKPLIADGTIKFYSSSADDTLLVMNLGKASQAHNTLHKFDKNLRYTADMFKNEVPQTITLNYHLIDLQFSEKTQTLVHLLISQALYLGHIILHG